MEPAPAHDRRFRSGAPPAPSSAVGSPSVEAIVTARVGCSADAIRAEPDGGGNCPLIARVRDASYRDANWSSPRSLSSAALRPAVTPTTPVLRPWGSSVELPSVSVELGLRPTNLDRKAVLAAGTCQHRHQKPSTSPCARQRPVNRGVYVASDRFAPFPVEPHRKSKNRSAPMPCGSQSNHSSAPQRVHATMLPGWSKWTSC